MKVNIDNIKRFKSKSSSIDEEFSKVLFDGLKAYLGFRNEYSQTLELPGGVKSTTCNPAMMDLLIQYEILKK
jgi:hypothetical protein